MDGTIRLPFTVGLLVLCRARPPRLSAEGYFAFLLLTQKHELHHLDRYPTFPVNAILSC